MPRIILVRFMFIWERRMADISVNSKEIEQNADKLKKFGNELNAMKERET